MANILEVINSSEDLIALLDRFFKQGYKIKAMVLVKKYSNSYEVSSFVNARDAEYAEITTEKLESAVMELVDFEEVKQHTVKGDSNGQTKANRTQ